MTIHPVSFVDANVRDLDRSVDFYRSLFDLTSLEVPDRPDGRRHAWLAGGPAVLRLTEVGAAGTESAWTTDDLQRGFRHLGFKVSDLDARAERVRAAGVPFHLEPLDAVGGVRIAFFRDPDGLMLEFIQGDLEYHKVWSDELLAAERGMPAPGTPRFDHVAVTVENLERSLRFYQESLGYEVIGQLVHDYDPRGFVITYLKAETTVIELFTYEAPKVSSPWRPDEETFGFRTIGFTSADPAASSAALAAAGATPVSGVRGATRQVFTDADGVPLAIEGEK